MPSLFSCWLHGGHIVVIFDFRREHCCGARKAFATMMEMMPSAPAPLSRRRRPLTSFEAVPDIAAFDEAGYYKHL